MVQIGGSEFFIEQLINLPNSKCLIHNRLIALTSYIGGNVLLLEKR